MSQLITMNQKTMSSREIVEMINNHRVSKNTVDAVYPNLRHSDFMAKVISVLGTEYSENFRSTYLADNGKTNPCYRFPKREACLMAMSYSYELQAKVFDHMTELESHYEKNVVKLPQTFSEALQLAADQAKQLELASPKVDYFDRVADRFALLNATQVGQKVSMSAVIMNRHLEDLSVYNKTVKRGRVFQQWFIDQGLGELKQTDSGHPQAMFTVKGEQWIIQKFISEGLV